MLSVGQPPQRRGHFNLPKNSLLYRYVCAREVLGIVDAPFFASVHRWKAGACLAAGAGKLPVLRGGPANAGVCLIPTALGLFHCRWRLENRIADLAD